MKAILVSKRILQQLKGDPRFLLISFVVPTFLIYLMKIVFDALSNPLMNFNKFVVPLVAFMVFFITFILSAIALVRDRNQGTLSRMFVNGFNKYEIIIGYLMGYLVLGTLQTIIVFFESLWLFNLDITTAEEIKYLLIIWVLAIISISLGTLISTLAQNEGQVFPFIPLVIIPSIFFSGILVSIDKLPLWAQYFARLIPFTYAYQGIDGLMNANPDKYWFNGLYLLLFGIALISLSSLTLRDFE